MANLVELYLNRKQPESVEDYHRRARINELNSLKFQTNVAHDIWERFVNGLKVWCIGYIAFVIFAHMIMRFKSNIVFALDIVIALGLAIGTIYANKLWDKYADIRYDYVILFEEVYYPRDLSGTYDPDW